MVFENLKKAMHQRIKKGTILSTLDGETVLMKKSGIFVKEWRVIYPPVIELDDGSLKWVPVNLFFGGKKALLGNLITLAIAVVIIFGVYDYVRQAYLILNNPTIQACLNPLSVGH